MIILEGPDGGGKTSLAQQLSKRLELPIADRVVSKETEALTDLRVWTDKNLRQGFQRVIFDRHRLISDPIYRAVFGNHNAKLYDPRWLAGAMKQFANIDPIIIFCMPPLEVVALNLADDPDNTVVAGDIEKIYYSYAASWCQFSAWALEFSSLHWYDYSNPFGLTVDDLVKTIKEDIND